MGKLKRSSRCDARVATLGSCSRDWRWPAGCGAARRLLWGGFPQSKAADWVCPTIGKWGHHLGDMTWDPRISRIVRLAVLAPGATRSTSRGRRGFGTAEGLCAGLGGDRAMVSKQVTKRFGSVGSATGSGSYVPSSNPGRGAFLSDDTPSGTLYDDARRLRGCTPRWSTPPSQQPSTGGSPPIIVAHNSPPQ